MEAQFSIFNCKIKDTMKGNLHFKNLMPDEENPISKTVLFKTEALNDFKEIITSRRKG